jgi:hypothetical protein
LQNNNLQKNPTYYKYTFLHDKMLRYITDVRRCNDNNLQDQAPFCVHGSQLTIVRSLWHDLASSWLKHELVDEIKEQVINDGYWRVYHLFNRWTSAEKWWHVRSEHGCGVVDLPCHEIPRLVELATKLQLRGGELVNDDLDEVPLTKRRLAEGLRYCCTPQRGAFIKTESCSTKHDFRPLEVFTVTESLTHVLSSHACTRTLVKEQGPHFFLLSPWMDQISKENEVRAFVKHQKVTGISQQYWFEVCQTMLSVWAPQTEAVFRAVDTLCASIFTRLTTAFQYDECCLDVWLEQKEEGTIIAHLIEINGRGGWGSAGSALYSWQYDPPDGAQREFRVRSTTDV